MLVENDMFDTALRILNKYRLQDVNVQSLLKILAGKPEAFHETKSKSVVACGCFKRAPKEKTNALPLLRYI
ncbi:hypothetical protein R6Q57_026339 [Mikania cordata]